MENGIVLCGINWGGDPHKVEPDNDNSKMPTFFSDAQLNNYPYSRKIKRWFELWGHPLQEDSSMASDFEHSIAQMNWLTNQSKNMNNQNIRTECIKNKIEFFSRLELLRPRLIFFFSVNLLDALNDPSCIEDAKKILGKKKQELIKIQKDVPLMSGKKCRRFRVGFQAFEKCEIVALPHPTGAKGINDAYISAFKDKIGPLITRYKEARNI